MPSLNENALGHIGLAARGQKVVSGDSLMAGIRNQSVVLVIVANDASQRTKKQLTTKCKYYQIQIITEFSSEQLSKAIGKNNRVAVGITDGNFKKMILK